MASRHVLVEFDPESGAMKFYNKKAQQHYDDLMAQIKRRSEEDARMDWDDNAEMPTDE